MGYVERSLYLNRLMRLKGKPDIKVITGIRRCGKSELMKSFISYLRKTEPQSNVVYIDLMDLDYENLKEYHALHQYAVDRHMQGVRNYLLVDEVQLCKRFEIAINSLYSRGIYDIYITGSNAFMLSSDLATLFTGRYFEIHVFPFSFSEYLLYTEREDIDRAFDDYVLTGGMSGSYIYDTEQERRDYISGVLETIITRDLTQKYALRDDAAIIKTADFLFDNIGNLTSSSGISNALKAGQIPASHITVRNYIEYLCRAYLFYRVQRYDIRGKELLKTLDKYYYADAGFRYARLGRRNMDYGRQYENLVALELLRKGYSIYAGKLYQKEIDFVAMNEDRKVYIQVCDDLSSEQTQAREKAPLLSIRDAYPKMIIARTKHEEYDIDGIRVVDIARWLKGEDS